MARTFRYYGKKRGNRRTGSPALASAGEAIFFAVLLLLGCGLLVLFFATLVIPQWRVNHEFIQHACRVVDKRVAEEPGTDGTRYRPKIKIEYEVGGVTYYSDLHYDIHNTYFTRRDDAQAVVDHFSLYDKSKNNAYPCWYDPLDPRCAVLVNGYPWWIWLVSTVPISFLLIGGGGLIYSLLHWGKSAERRALMEQRAQERDLFGTGGRGDRRYPFVPQGADIINSPGTRLPFRLPVARSTGWILFASVALCVLWNTCVALALVWLVHGFMAGKADWVFTIFLTPCFIIGVGAIVLLTRRLWIATVIGPTLVEISGHPLQPGSQCRVFLSQSGRSRINLLRVSLVCEESATYRQGTNTRTETQKVYQQELFRREGFEIVREQPFEAEFDLGVPTGAMHSFMADHNQINWTLAVEGNVADRPGFHRAFAVIVRPANGDSKA